MLESNISDFALIGDTRTAALFSSAGSIDWMCVPSFDGEPLFGRLIGGAQGGSFAIGVDATQQLGRRYRPDSAVLETLVQAQTGTGRILDGMVVDVSGELLPQLVLVRHVDCEIGRLRLRVMFDPKLGLPGRPPRAAKRAGGLVCEWGSLAVALRSSRPLDLSPGKEAEVELSQGSSLTLVMTLADRSPLVFVSPRRAIELLQGAEGWWRDWIADIDYDGPYAAAVRRSLVTLQLLTFSPSGAPVAAPTTSLPEVIGGSRNWDYRFSWPRDASIGLASFLALGKGDLAHSYMHWLLHASRLTRPRLEVLYTLYGKPHPKERALQGVPGYRDSRPVRVGNAASRQHQLDVYGWVLDAAWLLTKAGRNLHGETWRALSGFADFAAHEWRQPDAGIWEVRGNQRHYVHSKLMAWLCLDRAMRISSTYRTRERRNATWRRERDALANDIRTRGWDVDKGSYVRSYGSSDLDAALLILPVLEFEEEPSRSQGTIAAIRRELETNNGLVYRYSPGSDGLEGKEGTFLPCSFWLVQALAKIGERDAAELLFGRLLTLANDVGLFAEEIDPTSGGHLGNFPQALTHATLIQAALSLREAQES
jgi:GH15 family glucan-1,4-alpha-glucosidase